MTYLKPWSQLTLDEQHQVHVQMALCRGRSVNGVAGWYATQRLRDIAIQKKTPPPLPPIRNATIAPIETLTLEDVKDVLPD